MTDAVLVKEMQQQLAGLDPSSLSARDAEDLLDATVGVINAAWALAGRATRRVGETDAFRRCGDRSEAHHLGRVAGVGLGVAKTALEVTAATDTLAATGRAFRCGELSVRQTAAVCSAALVDRRCEGRLLRMARTRGINQLEEECARVRAAAAPDDEAERHRRARSERGAWKHTNRDGSAEIRFRSSTDDVAEAWAVIAAFAKRLVGQGAGSGEGERPTFDQHNADGFLDMCRSAAGGTILTPANEPTLPIGGLEPCRPAANPKKIIVRVDLAALLRGYPTDGEACDIPGYGPVPVTAVRDMVASGNPVLAAVVTKGVDVATVAHLGREPSAHQQTAMEWLDPRCRAEGCDRTIGLERDHRIDWSPTQVTLLGWMEWLCSHHHDLKTTEGWRLVHGKGVRPFVGPDDPRHPNNSPPPRTDGDHRGDINEVSAEG
ncbi:MAG: HNH endonuclease signature motif containing protein [Acidimicrobiales bacterium]